MPIFFTESHPQYPNILQQAHGIITPLDVCRADMKAHGSGDILDSHVCVGGVDEPTACTVSVLRSRVQREGWLYKMAEIFQMTLMHFFNKIFVFWFKLYSKFVPKGLNDNKSVLVQVNVWCKQVTSCYRNHWWPGSITLKCDYLRASPLCNCTLVCLYRMQMKHSLTVLLNHEVMTFDMPLMAMILRIYNAKYM